MEFGINLKFIARSMGLQKAAELVSRLGFTALDYTPPLTREHWQQEAREALAIFADHGLKVHQTHAPFNRYGHCGDQHGLYVSRCVEATALMGAQYMVVHGDEFDFQNREFTPEAALEYNHELFLPAVQEGLRCGFQVAFETVFEDVGRRRFTSDAGELLSLIRSYGDGAVCCWDFGHAHVAFRKRQAETVEQLGALIRCTHLHDNAGNDSHQIPMTGDIDWPSVMAAFRRIGYEGVFSVEYAHGNMPVPLMEDYLRLTMGTVRHLAAL